MLSAISHRDSFISIPLVASFQLQPIQNKQILDTFATIVLVKFKELGIIKNIEEYKADVWPKLPNSHSKTSITFSELASDGGVLLFRVINKSDGKEVNFNTETHHSSTPDTEKNNIDRINLAQASRILDLNNDLKKSLEELEERLKILESQLKKSEEGRKKSEEDRKKVEERLKVLESQLKKSEEGRKKSEEDWKKSKEDRKKSEEEGKKVEERLKVLESQLKNSEEGRKKSEEDRKKSEEEGKKVEEERWKLVLELIKSFKPV